jgi:phosphate transport system permease protein
MITFKRNSLLFLYLLFTVAFLSCFVGVFSVERTPVSVILGTLYVAVGSVAVALLPAYLMAGVLSGALRFPAWLHHLVSYAVFLLAGMPSIIYGVIGFVLFCQILGFGWSILSATLTLALMLIPTLTTGLVQVFKPLVQRYEPLNRSLGIRPVAFLFLYLPKFRGSSIVALLQLGWARAVADTAAVMLTCGVVLEMPQSVYDSIRVISYHIYLLAMEEPGGLPEARTLSLLLVVALIGLNLASQKLGGALLSGGKQWSPTAI